MNRSAAAQTIFARHCGILPDAISLAGFNVVQESRGIDGDSAEADPIFPLGILSIGVGKIRPAPLHRQQRNGCRRGNHGHHHDQRAGGLRHRASAPQVDECLPALVARPLNVSPDRDRRPGLEPARPVNWLNTYKGLAAAYVALSLPLAIWILTTFFQEVPVEIEEAALIDGCSRLQALYKSFCRWPPRAFSPPRCWFLFRHGTSSSSR